MTRAVTQTAALLPIDGAEVEAARRAEVGGMQLRPAAATLLASLSVER